ncbi:MAG: beta-galactosidase [Lachnospiraceae bacterium]
MKTDYIYFGAAYYDEYLPYPRIEQDMEMMKKAGMNTIRIAESTWSTLEPQEGVYDFSHIDRMLDAAYRHQINVIIGTPTYAIPSWLAKKSEDILALTKQGQEIYGRRQNMDLTSPIYLKYAENIIRVLLEHVAQHPCVIGYQIDNETHHYGTAGPRVQAMFIEHLKKQFPDIKEFNHEFGLDYWSNRVDNWDDFPDVRGTINGSLAAEFEKFQRSIVTKFHHWQASIIEEYRRPEQFITHNFDFEWKNRSFGLQPDANSYDCAACMTVAGGDIYHRSQDNLTGAEITICGNILRGLKRDNYLILETQAQGNIEWLPYPGQLRLCAYSHLANGANSVLYWHWHSIHNSFESYWKGVLSHDFSENDTYREAAVIGQELCQCGNRIKNLQKKNDVAIFLSHEALSGLKQFSIGDLGDSSYNTIVRWIGDALHRTNIEYDIIFPQEMHLNEYKLIFVPALYSAPESLLNELNQYVADGGHLAVTFRSGFSDEHLKIYSDTQPHILHECLGIRYDQFTIPQNVSLDCHVALSEDPLKIREWMELVRLEGAKSLADYAHPGWKGYSAITENHYNNGTAYYIGCYFEGHAIDELVTYIAKNAGISVPAEQFPVIVKEGINDYEKKIRYYLNYSSKPQTVHYCGENGKDLLGNSLISKDETFVLNAWDLKIIECDY